MKDVTELGKLLKPLSNTRAHRNAILVGDFNCPYISWDTATVDLHAQQGEVHQALIDITTEIYLTQIHSAPTCKKNLLDLVFTNTPSLVKTSISIPGISDHDIILTDFDTSPERSKSKPRKV